jgi:excisionase family DNA binding protein
MSKATVDELRTVKQAAVQLTVTPATVYGWISDGTLIGIRFGRIVRVSQTEIDRFIEDHKTVAAIPSGTATARTPKAKGRAA